MKNINKKQLSLSAVKSIRDLKFELRKIAQQNLSIVEIIEDDNLFHAADSDASSDFEFVVEEIYQDKENRIFFHGHCLPGSEENVEVSTYATGAIDSVVNHFRFWLNMLVNYNSIHLTEEDTFQAYYENEFNDTFEIIDEDADFKPFEYERQLFIYNYLQEIITGLEAKNEKKYIELVEQAKKLQQNLQNETKKSTVRKLSALLGKLRKMSIKLLNDFYDVGKKELLKKAFNSGLSEVTSLIDGIAN